MGSDATVSNDFRIIVGRPLQVEKQVNELLEKDGWLLHGELMKYRPAGELAEVLVQGMVRRSK